MAVVHYGSFSTAAEYCFVTQPTLSTQIGNLESELGVILLDRTNKPITLTEAGRVVLEQIEKSVSAFYGIKERLNHMRGEINGKLRIGVIPTISPFLMPRFITDFMVRCPKIELEINEMFTSSIVDALGRGMIDIGIMAGGQSEVKVKETKLFTEKLYLYASRKNRLFGRREVSADDIDVNELMLLAEGNCLRNQALKLCKAYKKKINQKCVFITGSLETLMRTVNLTGMVTIIPAMAVNSLRPEQLEQVCPFDKSANGSRSITMAVTNMFVRESLSKAVRESVLAASKEFELAEFMVK
jgi:LysR family hydrogen peroxide-inducible transcriptional activator